MTITTTRVRARGRRRLTPPAAARPTPAALAAYDWAITAAGTDDHVYETACRYIAALTGLGIGRLLSDEVTACDHCGAITTHADLNELDIDGTTVWTCELCDPDEVAHAIRSAADYDHEVRSALWNR